MTDVGALTAGQAEQLRGWLLDQAAAAELLAPQAGRYQGFHRGQADAWRAAELALRVAAVGALARPKGAGRG